jgi:triosephosphate isomerase
LKIALLLSMRRKFIGANWKMNLSKQESLDLFQALALNSMHFESKDVVIFPSQPFLSLFNPSKELSVGAQNFYGPELFGAYTGETSLSQLEDIGVKYTLVGHSERRNSFGEGDDFIIKKCFSALNRGLNVVFCCGESLIEREKGDHISFVTHQLSELILSLDESQLSQLVVAYEPIWAIGSGKVPSLQEINEMHQGIRELFEGKFGAKGQQIRIIYGGSCNEKNASDIFALTHVDGGLIGGASLKLDSFLEIIHSA